MPILRPTFATVVTIATLCATVPLALGAESFHIVEVGGGASERGADNLVTMRDNVRRVTADGEHFVALTPIRTLVEIEAGEGAGLRIRVANATPRTRRIAIGTTELTVPKDSGSFAVARDTDAADSPAAWLFPAVSSITLEPGDEAIIPVDVFVPEDAEPGLHAAGITAGYALKNALEGSRIKAEGRLVSHVLINVEGDAKASARLSRGASPRLLMGASEATFTALAANDGRTLLATDRALLDINQSLGTAQQQVPLDMARRINPDPPLPLALPGGTRQLTVTWDEIPLLGRVTPTLRVETTDGQTLAVRYPSVWILPPWWLLVLLAIAIALPLVRLARARTRTRVDAFDDSADDELS